MTQAILIVDDSIPQHNLVKAAMAEQSMTFYTAFDGASGLTAASSLQPDLILLDVDMPEMNGFDVCRLLKVNAATHDIPVIFLTASVSMDERICGFDLGAVDYINKPFNPAELCARVRVALKANRSFSAEPAMPPVADESAAMGPKQNALRGQIRSDNRLIEATFGA